MHKRLVKLTPDGDWKSWAANVRESPFPVEYTLMEVLNDFKIILNLVLKVMKQNYE